MTDQHILNVYPTHEGYIGKIVLNESDKYQTNSGKIHTIVILDRSGSMGSSV